LKDFKKTVKSFFQNVDSSQIALFYYAGHGLQYNNNNYLVPIDADIELEHDIEDETISFEYIQNIFNEINSKLSLFILDSCRDNPFADKITNFTGRSIAFDRGLANTTIQTKSQSIIAFATSPNNIAQDNINENNGIYTKHLLKHITTNNIKVEDIFKRTTKDVLQATNHSQEPWTNLKTYDDFYLNGEEQRDVIIQEKIIYKDKIIEKPIEVEKIVEKVVYKEKETVTPTLVGNENSTEVGVTNDLVWQDPDTGLIWQRKIDDRGYEWDEAFEYAKKLNSQKFGGYDDWRLPTIDELVTLGNIKLYRDDDGNGNDLGANNPLNDYNTYDEWREANCNKGYDNPNTFTKRNFIKEELLDSIKKQEYPWYWSSISLADNDSKGWLVFFHTGDTGYHHKSTTVYVRCVRGK
jgi:hypothetical protein